jgi:hypothetical protein
MYSLSKLISIFFILVTIRAGSQGIIIDHTCTDIDQIPETVIDDIQQNIKFHYAHTSHGDQLLCGLLNIENTNPLMDVAIGGDPFDFMDPPFLPNVPGALCIYNGNDGYKYIVPEGYWLEPGVGWTQSTIINNPSINVSGWMWCEQLDTCSAEFVQEYLNAMATFEQQFPDVTFIYFTGNAQAGGIFDPQTGYDRHQRCDLIRQYCAANNKILFDFEDLDSWYNGEFSYYLHNGDTVPIQHNAYNGDECGHVNSLSTLQKGYAVWWMMARLRGWEPITQSLNIKVFLEGNYTGTDMSTDINTQGLLPLAQPFNFPPINYSGIESVITIPNANVVDWVLIEIRDAADAPMADSSSTIFTKAAFILNTGEIVNLDGNSAVSFNHIINQQLFVVVRHRNHLGIMSAQPLTSSNNVYQYDFTTGSTTAYGGMNSQNQLDTDTWGMIAGDGNQDGIINSSDKTISWSPNTGENVYKAGDFNLNGNINNQDKNLFWINNFGRTSYIP